MTRKRRNILIQCLVSMLALLAIAVPMAQAEPGGLFDGASAAKPETPVPYAWLLNQGSEPEVTIFAPLSIETATVPQVESSQPEIFAPLSIETATVPQPDAVARFIDGNAPVVPNAVPGYPALLPEVAAPSVNTDGLPAFPPGPGGYVEPSTGVQPFPDLRPFPNLQPSDTGVPSVGIAPDRTPVTPVVEPTAGGFEWRDAAIGFSVAAVLALLAAGAVMILRNRDRVATSMS